MKTLPTMLSQVTNYPQALVLSHKSLNSRQSFMRNGTQTLTGLQSPSIKGLAVKMSFEEEGQDTLLASSVELTLPVWTCYRRYSHSGFRFQSPSRTKMAPGIVGPMKMDQRRRDRFLDQCTALIRQISRRCLFEGVEVS